MQIGRLIRDPRLPQWAARSVAIPVVAVFVVWLAHTHVGTSWGFAVAYGVIVGVGVFFASRPTQVDKIADAGRGLVISVLLALVATSLSHSDAKRSERNALALTLSSGHDLTGIDLHDRKLAGFFLGNKVLDDANLSGVNLHDAFLRHSHFINADLHGSNTDLTNADLRFADLRLADLRSANLEDADLRDADLRGAHLAGANLRNALLDGADARGADFRDADLRNSQLLGADLREAFLEADVRGAVFSGDLRDAKLDDAAIKRLRADQQTVWPPDFDLSDTIARLSAEPEAPVRIPKGATADSVVRVADGDTIALRENPRVRILGINAPRGERPSECYAGEATAALKRLLPAGTPVYYKLGVTRRDDFGRALAYVWTRGGVFVDERLVETGNATFHAPPKEKRPTGQGLKELPVVERFYVDRLKKAQIRAEMDQRGLWRICTTAS